MEYIYIHLGSLKHGQSSGCMCFKKVLCVSVNITDKKVSIYTMYTSVSSDKFNITFPRPSKISSQFPFRVKFYDCVTPFPRRALGIMPTACPGKLLT